MKEQPGKKRHDRIAMTRLLGQVRLDDSARQIGQQVNQDWLRPGQDR
jgi:hypothetical protein